MPPLTAMLAPRLVVATMSFRVLPISDIHPNHRIKHTISNMEQILPHAIPPSLNVVAHGRVNKLGFFVLLVKIFARPRFTINRDYEVVEDHMRNTSYRTCSLSIDEIVSAFKIPPSKVPYEQQHEPAWSIGTAVETVTFSIVIPCLSRLVDIPSPTLVLTCNAQRPSQGP